MKRNLKALIFDNGDILFDASLWRRWLAVHLNDQVEISKPLTYENLVPVWERHLLPVYRGTTDYWIAFRAMLTEFGIEDQLHDRHIEAAKLRGKQLQAERKPMPGVPETLRKLSEVGVKLAVLSDSESGESGVRSILKQLGIESYFEAVVSSRDIGAVKPDPEAFQFAIDRLGVPKSACGFVAHDIDELSGAIDYELYAIGYNYSAEAPADVFIESFDELLQLVGS